MNDEQRIKFCNSALEACKEAIKPDEYKEINEYINKYSEWGVGIEMLIDILCEDQAHINAEQFTTVQMAMESMGLGKSDRMGLLNQHKENT